MPCACKKRRRKRGSGSTYLSGVTWKGPFKKGRGISFRGGGMRKKRAKRGRGMAMSGSGMNFAGGGYIFDGSGFKKLVGYHAK